MSVKIPKFQMDEEAAKAPWEARKNSDIEAVQLVAPILSTNELSFLDVLEPGLCMATHTWLPQQFP